MNKSKHTTIERVLRKTNVPKNKDGSSSKTQCWEYKGAINNAGYGMLRGGHGIMATVHRIMYIEHYKTIDYSSLKYVLHKCGNKLCVNPDHLMLGDVKDRAELQRKYKAYNKNFSNPDYMWVTCKHCGNTDYLPHFKRRHSLCDYNAKHKYITQSISGKQ